MDRSGRRQCPDLYRAAQDLRLVGGIWRISAALSYAITGSGTVKGAFIVFGTGAVSTIDNTAGTLFSAGLFTAGDKIVGNGDTVNVSYSVSA